MIHHFSSSDLNAIQALLSNIGITCFVNRKLHRGSKIGIVKFQLVNCKGVHLIERTYVPSGFWKKASKRYVSFDAFLSECRALFVNSVFIDDLPF